MKFKSPFLMLFIAALIPVSGAQASITNGFSCKAAIYDMQSKSAVQCTVTIDPNDQSGSSRPKPGSIDTSKYSGTFALSCASQDQSILGNNSKMPMFQQGDLSSDEVQGFQTETATPFFQNLGKLAFDPSQVATISNYAVPYSVEWMMYFVGEAKDKSGNTLGYVIQYNGGIMAGCLAE